MGYVFSYTWISFLSAFFLICMVCEFWSVNFQFFGGIEQFIMVIMQMHYKTVCNERSTWQSVNGKAK